MPTFTRLLRQTSSFMRSNCGVWSLALISIFLIVVPTARGLWLSNADFVSQRLSYQDDGDRYVLPAGFPVDDEAAMLADSLGVCCTQPAGAIDRPTAPEWRQAAELLGWTVTIQNDASLTQTLNGVESRLVIFGLARGDSVVPLLLLDADGLLIIAYEPGQGPVLYRRRALSEGWTGLVMRAEAPPAGSTR